MGFHWWATEPSSNYAKVVLSTIEVFVCRVRGNVKKCLGDNEGALTDLTMAELLEHTTTVGCILSCRLFFDIVQFSWLYHLNFSYTFSTSNT